MVRTIPRDEQTAAILDGRTHELAARYCDGDSRRLDSAWTITLDDLLKHIDRNGLPRFVRTTAETYDGIYLIRVDGIFNVYEQERGCVIKQTERQFADYEAALRHILSVYYLPKRQD